MIDHLGLAAEDIKLVYSAIEPIITINIYNNGDTVVKF
jgi:hypothetical protein